MPAMLCCCSVQLQHTHAHTHTHTHTHACHNNLLAIACIHVAPVPVSFTNTLVSTCAAVYFKLVMTIPCIAGPPAPPPPPPRPAGTKGGPPAPLPPPLPAGAKLLGPITRSKAVQLQLPAASQDEDSDEARLKRGQLVKLRLEVIGLAASEEKFAGMLSKHIAGAEAKRAGIQKLAARVEVSPACCPDRRHGQTR